MNLHSPLLRRLSAYCRLMRIDRPIGTLLLLWPTLWALWLAAEGRPDPGITLVFVVGTFVMRAAGCVINDFADRDIDPLVSRTRARPLAAGEVSTTEALVLFGLLLAVAFALVLLLNTLAIKVAFAAAAVAVVYPFTKRFTSLPQGVLGIAFSMGIPMAYAAVRNELPAEAWLLFLANYLWIIAYDTQYAMADREDDLKAGIRSSAILFGRHDLLVNHSLHLVFLALMTTIGLLAGLGPYYYLGLVGAALTFVFQYLLCREREAADCFTAFVNNGWTGAMVYSGIVLSLPR